MLKIYNSLTRTKEEFKPINPGKIEIYVCGITVYDLCHIGHARTIIAFDIIVRYLKWRGYDVTYIRNITDIDDKIIKRAREKDQSTFELTEEYIKAMHEDFNALGLLPPDLEPKATEHIADIIDIIKTLIAKGFAYQAASGDVYYEVEKFNDYGRLSHRVLDDLLAGARVDVAEDKKSPLDFVLWKSSKPGEIKWDSPWGPGRPGWHIECSLMSNKFLGDEFDIHGGGKDLIFPHHENEIAQSRAATGKMPARYWLHAGHLNVDQEKMSKSLGNFFTIREVLANYPPEAIRYFVLSSHYRSPLNFSDKALPESLAALTRLYLCLRELDLTQDDASVSSYTDQFIAAMDDDFNTPIALAVLFNLVREINTVKDSDSSRANKLGYLLQKLGRVLGLLQQSPEEFLKSCSGTSDKLSDQEIEDLIAKRNDARANKNWQLADDLRKQLEASGIILEDGADGTKWRRS